MANQSNTIPGPWTAHELGDEDGSWSKWSVVAHGPIAYGGDNGNGADNSRATAHLMAAAPDLLQVAEDFILLADLHDWEGAAIDNARAAIAKARGTNRV